MKTFYILQEKLTHFKKTLKSSPSIEKNVSIQSKHPKCYLSFPVRSRKQCVLIGITR